MHDVPYLPADWLFGFKNRIRARLRRRIAKRPQIFATDCSVDNCESGRDPKMQFKPKSKLQFSVKAAHAKPAINAGKPLPSKSLKPLPKRGTKAIDKAPSVFSAAWTDDARAASAVARKATGKTVADVNDRVSHYIAVRANSYKDHIYSSGYHASMARRASDRAARIAHAKASDAHQKAADLMGKETPKKQPCFAATRFRDSKGRLVNKATTAAALEALKKLAPNPKELSTARKPQALRISTFSPSAYHLKGAQQRRAALIDRLKSRLGYAEPIEFASDPIASAIILAHGATEHARRIHEAASYAKGEFKQRLREKLLLAHRAAMEAHQNVGKAMKARGLEVLANSVHDKAWHLHRVGYQNALHGKLGKFGE